MKGEARVLPDEARGVVATAEAGGSAPLLPDASAVAPGAGAVYEGLRRSSIRTVIYIPDSSLYEVTDLVTADPAFHAIVCAREDEGLGIAAGMALGGELAAVLMEGSGIGYSGLILGRMLLQRTPALVLAAHTRVFGEARDYHAGTRLVGEGVLAGLGVPYAVITNRYELDKRVHEAAVTAVGQRQPVCLLLSAPTMTER